MYISYNRHIISIQPDAIADRRAALHPCVCLSSQCIAHLSCRNELKWSESDFEVGGIGLQVVERTGDAGLKLGRVLTRWARGRDLIEGAHDCGVLVEEKSKFSAFAIRKVSVVGCRLA